MMKTKYAKRVCSFVMALGMTLSLLPATALAATEVIPTPSQDNNTKLQVEYFTSTLYNWNEEKANQATKKADTGKKITSSNNASDATKWTITEVADDIYTISADGKYLTWSGLNSPDAVGASNVTKLTVENCNNNDRSGSVTIGLSGTSASCLYLNYYDNKKAFGGWSDNGFNDEGSAFYICTINNTETCVTVENIESGGQYYIKSHRSGGFLTLSNEDGANAGKGFYFTTGGSGTNGKPTDNYVPAFSKWIETIDGSSKKTQNYYIYSGLAASKFSESSNAPFSDAVNAAKLFADENNDYTEVYKNVKVPYIYNEKTGYYEMNSDKNAVYFANGNRKSGATMQIADLPAGYEGYLGNNDRVTGFAPFNSLSKTIIKGKLSRSSESSEKTDAYKINSASDTNYRSNGMKYGFGMVTNVNFQMTDTGKDTTGKDIIFEFSGDDDVWVYVDGVLALDIGGTHDAITGTINFATGDVTLSSSSYGKVGDKAVDEDMSEYSNLGATLSQTNLYTALGTTLTGFAASGDHTLTIYYMDRGQGRTNCMIKFNLPQRDSFSVTKSITQSKDTNGNTTPLTEEEQANIDGVDFGFTLYRDHAVVPNKTYYLTYTENGETKQKTASTDANGHFTLKNGQTAKFIGEISASGTSLYVVEDTLNTNAYTTPEYRYTTNISEDKVSVKEANGFTSMKLTANGSDTTSDSIDIICTNYLSKELPNPSIQPADDLIVVDYGLPISISTERLLSNDTRRGDSFEITEIKTNGKYGTATLSEDKTTITYTLEKRLDGIEELTYTAVAHSNVGGVNDSSGTGKIKIIPATSVYYEENFGSEGNKLVTTKYNVGKGAVEEVGESRARYQETGYMGDPNDSTYGADAVYLNNLKDSCGTSLKADTTGGAVQYSYSFTGTGTTIYGRVSDKTGYIRVTVTSSEVDNLGKPVVVDTQYIDTINLATQNDGETNQTLDATLYNIPIYQNTNLSSNEGESGYGTYTVTIYVYKNGTLHTTNNEFYLDGIRVFQPMGTSTEDNKEYATANSAYSADGEQNVAVLNIREKIVRDSELDYTRTDDLFTLTDVEGSIQSVEEYANIGPNQELYLKETYTGSFALVNWNSKDYKLYLGMKAPDGNVASVNFLKKTDTGASEILKTISINNSTDCYYDISDYVVSQTLGDDTVIGYVNIQGAGGLTALTNLKITGVDEFNLAYSTDVDADNEENEGGDGETENTLYLVSRTFAENMAAEEESPVFTPDSIKISSSYARILKIATVNVVTSDDVSYVTINDVKVTGRSIGGKLWFTKYYKKVPAGTTYEVVAYNADGVASEVYTVTAK